MKQRYTKDQQVSQANDNNMKHDIDQKKKRDEKRFKSTKRDQLSSFENFCRLFHLCGS